MKAAHHRGSYQSRATRVTDTAKANPATRCCTCGHTLDQCGPNNDGRNLNGTPCTWDAGHPDGRWQAGELRAECSACNRQRGAAAGNRRRTSGYDWP